MLVSGVGGVSRLGPGCLEFPTGWDGFGFGFGFRCNGNGKTSPRPRPRTPDPSSATTPTPSGKPRHAHAHGHPILHQLINGVDCSLRGLVYV